MKTLDIVKCLGTDCPKAQNCYRYVKEPLTHYQAYFTIGVNIKDVKNCNFFYPIPDEEI